MNESDFDQLAEETMLAIEEAIDESGADIDYDNAGGILTLEFPNGSQIIVNKQAPLKQLWVAARSGGFHFDYDGHASMPFDHCAVALISTSMVGVFHTGAPAG